MKVITLRRHHGKQCVAEIPDGERDVIVKLPGKGWRVEELIQGEVFTRIRIKKNAR